MSVWAFYLMVLKRAFASTFGLAEKIELLLAIVGGAAQFFFPTAGKIVAFFWIAPLTILVLTWLYRLILSPYQLYSEAALALDVYIKAGVSAEERASIRDELSKYVFKAQNILDRGANYRAKTSAAVQDAFAWAHEVEGYLDERLGKQYRARFRLDAQLPSEVIIVGSTMPPVLTEPMNRRCANLLEIIKELS